MIAIAALGLLQPCPEKQVVYNREGFVIVRSLVDSGVCFRRAALCLSGWIPNFVDSIFETVSGFTTTGASILTDIEVLPLGASLLA